MLRRTILTATLAAFALSAATTARSAADTSLSPTTLPNVAVVVPITNVPPPTNSPDSTTPPPADEAVYGDAGPGIVVCDPVSDTPTLASFGSGCASWLQLVVGGHGEFGKTPTWRSLQRAPRELGQHDLAVTKPQAKTVASLFGVTDVVVGMLTGTAANATLTLTVTDATGAPVGSDVSLTGSLDDIVNQLPAAANKICGALGHTDFPAAPSVGINANDLATAGTLRWSTDGHDPGWVKLPHEDKGALTAVIRTGQKVFQTDYEPSSIASAAVKFAPDNVLAVSEATLMNPQQLDSGVKAAYFVNLVRYSDNFAMLDAKINLTSSIDVDSTIAAARHVVATDPLNPDSHRLLAHALELQANAILDSKPSGGLTDDETDQLDSINQSELAEAQKATQLDPNYAAGWLQVAKAYTELHKFDDANEAYWKSVSMSQGDIDVYKWGYEMFEPKWFDKPELLTKVTSAACKDTSLGIDQLYSLGDVCDTDGLPNEKLAVLFGGVVANGEDAIKQGNALPVTYQVLATTYGDLNMPDKAKTTSDALIAKFPSSPEAQSVVDASRTGSDPRVAQIHTLQDRVASVPDDAIAHASLAQLLYDTHHYDEAEMEYRTTIKLSPTTAAYIGLTRTLLALHRPSSAVRSASEGLQYDRDDRDLNDLLSESRVEQFSEGQ